MKKIATIKDFTGLFLLTFSDLLVGIDFDFIRLDDLEMIATHHHDTLAELTHSSDFLVDLVLADSPQIQLQIITKLADLNQLEISKRKWLYVELRYLYDHIQDFNNPLVRIEALWADFDYNDRIKDLIYYMPAENIEQAKELGKRNIFNKWRVYLDREGEALSARNDPAY